MSNQEVVSYDIRKLYEMGAVVCFTIIISTGDGFLEAEILVADGKKANLKARCCCCLRICPSARQAARIQQVQTKDELSEAVNRLVARGR